MVRFSRREIVHVPWFSRRPVGAFLARWSILGGFVDIGERFGPGATLRGTSPVGSVRSHALKAHIGFLVVRPAGFRLKTVGDSPIYFKSCFSTENF